MAVTNPVALINVSGSTLYPSIRLRDIVTYPPSGSTYQGIYISNDTIQVRNVPQANITGLSDALNAKQNTLLPGFHMAVNGATVGQARYFALQPNVTGGTAVLSAGCAYNITATGTTVKLTAESFGKNMVGLEGHARIYVSNNGAITTDTRVVLANHITPNMYNNCTIRFHDDHAVITVEDHISP